MTFGGGDLRGLKVIITGGGGFIGANLAGRLAAEGASVLALLRPSGDASRLEGLGPHVRWTRLDLADTDALRAVVLKAQADVAFHLAVRTRRDGLDEASDAIDTLRTDLAALFSVIEALKARPPRMMIRTGSLAEYGDGTAPAREDQRERPLDPYAAALVAAAAFTGALAPSLPYPLVTARLALVYGPGQSEAFLMSRILSALLEDRPVHIRHPAARRDLLHVDDAVEALVRLIRIPQPPGALLNFGSNAAPTMREAALTAVAATGARAGLVTYGPPGSAGSPACLLCDSSLAAERLGWRARHALPEGLRRTVAALREQRREQPGVPA